MTNVFIFVAIAISLIAGGFCQSDLSNQACPADGTICRSIPNCQYSQGSCHEKHCESPSEADFALCAATKAVVIDAHSIGVINTELEVVPGVALLPCVGNRSSLLVHKWVLHIKYAACSADEIAELTRDARLVVSSNGTVTATAGRFRTIKSSIAKSCDSWNRVDPTQDCMNVLNCDTDGALRRGSSAGVATALCIAGAAAAMLGEHRSAAAAWPLVVAFGASLASAQETSANSTDINNSTCSVWLEVLLQSTQRDHVSAVLNSATHSWSLAVAVVVAGRPFVTADGESVVAGVAPMALAPPTALAASARQPSAAGLSRALVAAAALENGAASADSWLQQAVAEHASVASFAQFTLDLMANAAPSPLLMSALRAAQDEVLHADACLEMARASVRDSSLSFTAFPGAAIDAARARSLLDLARATMRDGAIAELLSTLLVVERAVEAQRRSLHSTAAVWRAIATDEARHALLAWRTVAWCLSVVADSSSSGSSSGSDDRQRLQQMLAAEVELAAKVAQSDTHRRAMDDLVVPLLARVNAGTFVDGAADAEAHLTSLLAQSESFDVETVMAAIMASC